MKKTLSLIKVIRIAKETADGLGVDFEEIEVLIDKLTVKYPMPVIIINSGYQLWIDRSYVAYSHEDEPDVHYVYLTQHHIQEEYQSYYIARHQRKSNICLPKHISEQFRMALHEMNANNKKYHVFEIR